jgi:regulator of protease activity HflC (stomatin/prohibitin superfamily)
MIKTLARLIKFSILAMVVVFMLRGCFLTKVEPGSVGVRYNNAFGLLAEDLGPGWHWELVGFQRIWHLPTHYLFLNYTGRNALEIRTKDNNVVIVDVSVPYRIMPGSAYKVMDAGNHLDTGNGNFRFERFANDTTISVLRESLAQLQSAHFYDTDERLKISNQTLAHLKKKLANLHLEPAQVLIRAAYFRKDYETQLAKIQHNEQQKLLDKATQKVATKQQKLDNYTQETNAQASALEQDWARKIAELDRSYQVGFVDSGEDRSPGTARRVLTALPEDKRAAMKKKAAAVFSVELEKVNDEHLLGIKNIEAETSEYGQRITSAADGVSARLDAEGKAMVAKVRGEFETKLNALLNSPGGRAFVAYQAADNITFASELVFQSSDGVPSVLRLRDFAMRFMGK